MKKYLAFALVFATPAVLADMINIACPPGDKVVVHTVTNNGDFDGSGIVGDEGDLAMLKANFGLPTVEGEDTEMTDLNGDGVTNTLDFALFRMLARNTH